MDDVKKKALEDLIGEAFDRKSDVKVGVERESEDSAEGKCKCGCDLMCDGCKKLAADCDC
jgi:hypothetical protein